MRVKVIKPDGHPADITSGQVLKALQPVAKKQSGNTANTMRKNLVAGWNWGIKYLGLSRINPFLIDRFSGRASPKAYSQWGRFLESLLQETR